MVSGKKKFEFTWICHYLMIFFFHFCFQFRHAALEGYIHQFLYTYRFFCTAEQLLQFIMDKFLSAAR